MLQPLQHALFLSFSRRYYVIHPLPLAFSACILYNSIDNNKERRYLPMDELNLNEQEPEQETPVVEETP